MARILCAWEFGGGMGHLTRLLPISRRLHDCGHDITLVVRDVRNIRMADPILERTFPGYTRGNTPGYRLQILEGVNWCPVTQNHYKSCLADVLLQFGFQKPDLLAKVVHKWSALLEEVEPDLIVADFAPTLRLSNQEETPFVMIGNGYTVPPAGRLLPAIRPWEQELPPSSRANEAEILRALNLVRQRTNGPRVDYVADVFNGDRSFICTIPEFDPYWRYRDEPTLVPFNVPVIESFTHVSERQENPILVYLPAHHPLLKAVLTAVNHLGIRCDAYINNARPEEIAAMCGPNVNVYRKPLNFSEVLSKYRLIIHHAGLGTAYAALRAGTPQLVMPKNLEHSVTAKSLVQLGAARIVMAREASQPEIIMSSIKQLAEDEEVWDGAYRIAKELADFPEGQSLDLIVEECLKCLSPSRYVESMRTRRVVDSAGLEVS